MAAVWRWIARRVSAAASVTSPRVHLIANVFDESADGTWRRISQCAINPELRDKLVPINKKYPLKELLAACERYLAFAPRDFITFEYVMLDGVNDSDQHARELIQIARQVHCKFNLIPFNPFPASGLLRSPNARVQAFAKILLDAGIVTTVRKTRGDDIDAACGQLAGDVKDRTKVQERVARQRANDVIPILPATHTETRP